MKDKPAESCEPRANYLNIVPDSYHCGTCGKNNLPVPPLKHDCMKAETQDAGEIAVEIVKKWFSQQVNLDDSQQVERYYLAKGIAEAIERERAKATAFKDAANTCEKLFQRECKRSFALEQKLAQAQTKIEDLRHRLAMGGCENCEPVYCCGGRSCGCYGMPVEYKATDKCPPSCGFEAKEKSNG